MRVSIYTDGASKGNPGPSGCGAVIRFPDRVVRLAKGLGIQTNNVAEYEGVLLGLGAALEAGATHIRVYTDSELVVRQITGAYTTKNPALRSLMAQVSALKAKAPFCTFSHVFREDNEGADLMANRGVKLAEGQVEVS